jgi:hypothetical protein
VGGRRFQHRGRRNDVKAQNLHRDSRASLAVYENDMPLRGLELRGTARMFTDDLPELRRRIYLRCMGEAPKTPDEDEIGVRIEGTIRAWDFAD